MSGGIQGVLSDDALRRELGKGASMGLTDFAACASFW